MSVLYLHFESSERNGRAQKLHKSGAHVMVMEPRWPGFFEVAKKEKPYAIAIDFSYAPSHAIETADYLTKARETREASFYLLRVPEERLEIVKKRLPHAAIVTEDALTKILEEKEREERARALEKKEAAALARKNARAKKAAAASAAAPQKPKPVLPVKLAKPKKAAAAKPSPKKASARKGPDRKKSSVKKKPVKRTAPHPKKKK